jgi:catechol 2,3-dioxygenase-like lactoylglutathione lyase family enzyme
MTIEQLDHYSIRTADVERSVGFYGHAMGLRRGARPPFNFPGAWLYRSTADGEVTGGAVVHIIGIDPNDARGLADYLGDKALTGAPGSGALDHIAFAASNIADMYARLALHGIGFRQRRVPNMALHQIFIDDPDGITIELNYAQPQDIAAGQASLAATAGA